MFINLCKNNHAEKVERERRVRKRKARLTEAAEDAFSHVRRQLIPDASLAGNDSMDPRQTAEIVFPSIARSMQKYLRTTRLVIVHMA